MVRFADKNTENLVREMWKICFQDSEEFMDLYFSRKYSNQNTLIYIEDNIPVASLQMLPYRVRFYGKVVPFSYISGACTLPAYRKRGYMGKLLTEAFRIMKHRGFPLTILIPAEDWLYSFYARYGYERTFERHGSKIDLQKLLLACSDKEDSYKEFNRVYQQHDFCVLKTKEDFITIMEDYQLSGCPDKYNLSGMARVLDAFELLKLYAGKNAGKSFTIRIEDEIFYKDIIYYVSKGEVKEVDVSSCDLNVDISMLTRLLFGYHTSELAAPFSILFGEHFPVMNLMLE